MIVKMYNTTLLCLADDKEQALKELQNLGVMHVEISRKNDSVDRSEIEQAAVSLEKVINNLAGRSSSLSEVNHTGREIAEKTLELLDEYSEFSKRLDALRRDIDKLRPWGDFSNESVDKLKASDIHVYLCSGTQADLDKLRQRGACEIVSEDKGKLNFAFISMEEVDTATLPLANLPLGMSLDKCLSEADICDREMHKINKALDDLSAGLELVKEYQLEVEEKLDFLNSRDGMIHEGQIAYLQGYVPRSEMDNLKEAAARHGWALHYEKADENNPAVPTLLKIPKAFRMVEPLMNFLGIAPGYNEIDVSVCFLFFLTIYFGMILGDAGYGVIIFTVATVARFMVKAPLGKKAVNLFTIFGLATIAWGALTGTWFGMNSELLPEGMRGIDFFSKPEIKDRNIQFFCFILAITHLTTGRLWKAIICWNSPRAALGEIGWAVILWGNFFVTLRLLVYPGPIENFVLVLYCIGLVMVISCGINWSDMGDVFNFPFGVIGTFVDILSYIRLYAVGMAGFYIANSFNGMGASIWEGSSGAAMVIMVIIGIIVILFGHLLNLALCFMGVLVHGVRLNTLEFSNHIGLRWAGLNFKPFAKKTNISIDKGEEK
ncbi:MAG: hypothetical protein JXR78_17965 [Victivallales bacterium]|nr:hypothetical protein [Victivallales bacterium]